MGRGYPHFASGLSRFFYLATRFSFSPPPTPQPLAVLEISKIAPCAFIELIDYGFTLSIQRGVIFTVAYEFHFGGASDFILGIRI